MKNVLNLALAKVAQETNLDLPLVTAVYKSYWRYVRESISSLDIENMSEESLEDLRTSFNIPFIGKLYTSYDIIHKNRKKTQYLEQHVKNQGNKTVIQSGSVD